jgi:ferritin-like metal-binding protein YciE
MVKKFLLRMTEQQFQSLSTLAKDKSLNQYLNEIIDDHIDKFEGRISKMNKIVINELNVNEIREAVVNDPLS